MVKISDPSLAMNMRHFQIVGRAAPTEKNTNPKIFRMKLFARNNVVAKSKFWYYMKRINKAKKTGGEVLAVNEIHEKKPLVVKIYAIWLRYDSRSGTHNMYKEFRDTTLNGAMGQMFTEMAGRHRARCSDIQVMKTAVIKAGDARRDHVKQWLKRDLKYPTVRRVPLVERKYKTLFKAARTDTFAQ